MRPVTTLPPEPPPPAAEPGTETIVAPAGVENAVLAEAADVVEGALDPREEEALEHLDNPRRLLLVHAHPDDETTSTGVTMARYAASGAYITLITCTRGEEGEVVSPDLAHLTTAGDAALAEHRMQELAAALEALGVEDHRYLGDPGEYRDSGMAGTPSNEHPQAFCRTPVDEAALRLVSVIREVRPQVVVTYDPRGGYEHPDHIQAHRVTTRAVDLAGEDSVAGGEPWKVGKVYWSALPESLVREGLRRMRAAGDEGFGDLDPDGELPFTTPDADITTVVDGRDFFDAKLAAWRAYPSQVSLDTPFLRMADDAREFWGREYYRLARGRAVPDSDDPDERETDLFAGIA